LEAINRKK